MTYTYKTYKIYAEVSVPTKYEVDENGNISHFVSTYEIVEGVDHYVVETQDYDYVDSFDTIEMAKQYIDFLADDNK